LWDSEIEDTFYYPEGSRWIRFSLTTWQSSQVADMSYAMPDIKNGGSTHVSSDNWTAFWSESSHKVCALNLRNAKKLLRSLQLARGGLARRVELHRLQARDRRGREHGYALHRAHGRTRARRLDGGRRGGRAALLRQG